MCNKIAFFLSIIILICATSCNKVLDAINELKELDKQPQVTTFASGLTAPLGIESDAETDIFNLTIGPGRDLFIADAAANAIIRRKAATGELSVLETIPAIDNPSGNPDKVQAVPTGIVFDRHKFLVCTFTGYPYPAQRATIYQVDLNGNTSVYQTALSTLTDIELGIDQKPVVLEYGTWTGETFVQNSGAIVRSAPNGNTPIVTGLNFPNSIKRSGFLTYYIAQTYEGKIQKVLF